MKAKPKKNPKKLRINSVISPNAVSTTQARSVFTNQIDDSILLQKIEDLRKYGLAVHVVAS